MAEETQTQTSMDPLITVPTSNAISTFSTPPGHLPDQKTQPVVNLTGGSNTNCQSQFSTRLIDPKTQSTSGSLPPRSDPSPQTQLSTHINNSKPEIILDPTLSLNLNSPPMLPT